MKTKTSFFAVIATFLLFTILNLKAQTPRAKALRLGVGADIGVPITSNTANLMLGPSLRLQWDFPKRASLTLTGAYEAFIEKDELPDGRDYVSDQIPVKLGGKFFFGNSYTFYVHPEAGASFSAKQDYGNAFVYSGGIGYVGKKGFDMALRYEGYQFGNSNKVSFKENFGLIALRLAYGFKLK
jgi:hypothetical protein